MEAIFKRKQLTDRVRHSTNLFFRKFPNRTSIVRLKCAEGKKDTATFKVLDEDNWVSGIKNELPLIIMLSLIILPYEVK